jgi:hypothetical protein
MKNNQTYVVWGKHNPTRPANDDTKYPVDKLILVTSNYWEALEKLANIKKNAYDFCEWVEVYMARNIEFKEQS